MAKLVAVIDVHNPFLPAVFREIPDSDRPAMTLNRYVKPDYSGGIKSISLNRCSGATLGVSMHRPPGLSSPILEIQRPCC